MKLIVITTPAFFIEEDRIITALFEEGLDYLHLRKPGTGPVYSERLLSLIPDQYHKRIVTHDHFYLKNEFNLMGIHLNHRNPDIPDKYRGHVSCSCHSMEEVKRFKEICGYVFISPVFDSISKSNYDSAYTKEQITNASESGIIDRKVVALGGINKENLHRIKEFGFGGAALSGDIWNKFDTLGSVSYRHVIEHFKELKKIAK